VKEITMDTWQRVELITNTVQQAIERGATSVEEIHAYIADLPFEALARTGLLEEEPLQLRGRQRRAIGVVYEAIRHVTHAVGGFVAEQIENLEDSRALASRLRDR
jgi:hypothetical protein